MNPQYKIQITLTLVNATEANNIHMRMVRYIPFVPRDGDTLRLYTDKGDEETIIAVDVAMGSVVYDTREGVFIAEVEDTTILDAHFAGKDNCANEVVARYLDSGFGRMNYPTAQAIRK